MSTQGCSEQVPTDRNGSVSEHSSLIPHHGTETLSFLSFSNQVDEGLWMVAQQPLPTHHEQLS